MRRHGERQLRQRRQVNFVYCCRFVVDASSCWYLGERTRTAADNPLFVNVYLCQVPNRRHHLDLARLDLCRRDIRGHCPLFHLPGEQGESSMTVT